MNTFATSSATGDSEMILLCESVNSVPLPDFVLKKQIQRVHRSTRLTPSTKNKRIQDLMNGKLRQCTSMLCCGGNGRAIDDDDDNEIVPSAVSTEILTQTQRRSRLTNHVDNKWKWCVHYNKHNSRFYFACCGVIDPCHRCHMERGTCVLLLSSLCSFVLFSFLTFERSHFVVRFLFIPGCDVKPPMITTVCCNRCYVDQPPSAACTNCNLVFGRTYCEKCLLWTKLDIFHCEKCGQCRRGKVEENFHCDKCEACFNRRSMEFHRCNNIPMTQQKCAICFDALSNSQRRCMILRCGHAGRSSFGWHMPNITLSQPHKPFTTTQTFYNYTNN